MSGRWRAPVVRIGGVELGLSDDVAEAARKASAAEDLAERRALAPLPPRGQRSSMTEKVWQGQIIELARRQLGWFVYHPFLSQHSERGWPDLSLLGTRALWIECKTDTGELTAAQAKVIRLMRANDLEVYVLRPWHGLQLVADILTKGPQEVPVT